MVAHEPQEVPVQVERIAQIIKGSYKEKLWIYDLDPIIDQHGNGSGQHPGTDTMPTAIKIRMAGIAFAIFSETPSIISSQVSPTRHAIKGGNGGGYDQEGFNRSSVDSAANQ